MKEYFKYLLNEKNFKYNEIGDFYSLELNNKSYVINMIKNKVRILILNYDNGSIEDKYFIEDEYFIGVKELNEFLMKHLSKTFRKEKIEKFLK